MSSIINATTTAGVSVQGDNSGSLQLATNNGTTAVTIDTSQNVGIGTTTINDRLVVQSSSAEQGITIRGDGLDAIKIGMVNPSVSNDGVIGMKINNALRFITNNTERMRIDSSGNLLVGTTTLDSAEKLNVLRNSITTNALAANFSNSAAVSTTKLASKLMRISSSGNGADVHIGFTDAIANNYYFGGNNAGAYVVANSNGVRLSNGGTSWASDSDERVKDIIEPITDAVNKVSTIRAVIGKYKTDEEGTRRAFLIAQDVQAVLPEAVFDEQGTLMLAYTETIPLLVAAIKELKAELDATKAEVQALKGTL